MYVSTIEKQIEEHGSAHVDASMKYKKFIDRSKNFLN